MDGGGDCDCGAPVDGRVAGQGAALTVWILSLLAASGWLLAILCVAALWAERDGCEYCQRWGENAE